MKAKGKLAEEWFERGKRDLEVAQLLLEQDYYSDVIAFHIQQAFEKYLKGYLIYHGWKLRKIHDLEELITHAGKINADFLNYLDFARKVSAYYLEQRYPPGPPPDYSTAVLSEDLSEVKEIVSKIKTLTENEADSGPRK